MKTNTERTAENTAVLTIEFEPQDQNRLIEHGYRHVAGRVNIPGFRPGKAPRPMVERFVGKETLLQEGLDHELASILRDALAEANLRPYGQPEVDIANTEPLTLTVTIALFPEIELGDYKSVRVPRQTVVVENADIDTAVNDLRERFATWQDITDRAVKWGDRVKVDMVVFPTGELDQAGEPEEANFDVDAEATRPFPRFADELIGMQIGETREFGHDFPEDEMNPEWAGKIMTFRVTLKEIKQKNLPEANDELAQMEGRYQTFDELREGLANDLKARGEQEEARRIEDAALAAVAERAAISIPQKMIDNQVEALLQDRLNFYTMFGLPKPSLEQYLTAVQKSEEEVREELQPQARQTLVNTLALQQIADAEDIQVSDEELDAEINRMAERAGKEAGQIRRRYRNLDQRDNLRFRLRQEKALAALVKMAAPEDEPYEATSPVARMLLGQETAPAQSEDEGLVRTESGLVIPGYIRQQDEQQTPEAPAANPEVETTEPAGNEETSGPPAPATEA